MTKRKKIILLVISAIVFVAMVVGVCVGLHFYLKNNISFAIEDTLPQGNGKRARVILLAGQSNATGCSLNEYLKRNVTAEQYAEYQTGYDNVFINYYCSGNNISSGFVKTSTNQGETTDCFGPEVGLVEKLHEEYPDELFFIIKFAWGATDLYSQWISPSGGGKAGYLYHNFVRYVKMNMQYLLSKGYNAKIEGMCWMQGESDSFFTTTAIGYENNLKNFIKDMRTDFAKYAKYDNIAFVDAYIANNPVFWVYCDLVNASKQAVADDSIYNVVIDTNANGLVCDQEPEGAPDIPHYDSLSQIKLGNLFAEQIMQFI